MATGHDKIIAGLRRIAEKSIEIWEDSMVNRKMKGSGAASQSAERALRNLYLAEDRVAGRTGTSFTGVINLNFEQPPAKDGPKA